MAQHATLSKLAPFAEDQWGLITSRQAKRAEVSPATLQRLSDGGVLDRISHGVYRLSGAPLVDHLELRAAWLQLAPAMAAWERGPEQGVVSYRSAAAIIRLGHLPADRHEFTFPGRRQTRRSDVRLHRARLAKDEWHSLRGLPVTKPARTASDLLGDRADPEAVAQVIADALRRHAEPPARFAEALAPYASRYRFRAGDGHAILRWLLELSGDKLWRKWINEARGRPLPGDDSQPEAGFE